MRAILPLDAALVHQLEEGFVHEGRDLKRVAGMLARDVPARYSMELAIDERRELIERLGIAALPSVKQVGDIHPAERRAMHGAFEDSPARRPRIEQTSSYS